MSKKITVVSALIVLACFALVLTGCIDNVDKIIENVIGSLIESENKSIETDEASPRPAEAEDQHTTEQDSGSSQAKPGSDSNSIPEDYPMEFCPIYEPSTIIDTEQINVEDKVIYIIQFVSKDEMNTIGDFYLELEYVTDELRLGDVICQIHLENKSEKNSGMINLERVEESDFASYASEGYKIYGTIMVDIGW